MNYAEVGVRADPAAVLHAGQELLRDELRPLLRGSHLLLLVLRDHHVHHAEPPRRHARFDTFQAPSVLLSARDFCLSVSLLPSPPPRPALFLSPLLQISHHNGELPALLLVRRGRAAQLQRHAPVPNQLEHCRHVSQSKQSSHYLARVFNELAFNRGY